MNNKGLQGLLVMKGKLEQRVSRQNLLIGELIGDLESALGWIEDSDQHNRAKETIEKALKATKGKRV